MNKCINGVNPISKIAAIIASLKGLEIDLIKLLEKPDLVQGEQDKLERALEGVLEAYDVLRDSID